MKTVIVQENLILQNQIHLITPSVKQTYHVAPVG